MNKRVLGKICGAAGAVLVVASIYVWFISGGSGALTGGTAALGVVLLAVFLATNWAYMGQFTSKKGTSFFFTSAAMTIAVLVGLAAVNYIVNKKNKSWDLTAKKIHSLSPQTQQALKDLTEKITAIGFLPANAPEYTQLENVFKKYQEQQPDKFDYTFKDPNKNPDLAAKYNLKEGQATVVLTRGTGDKQQQTSLNIISEQELTNALLKLNSTSESKICFVVGHGEYPLEKLDDPNGRGTPSMSELVQSLKQEGYTSTTVNLATAAEIEKGCALLVIAGARAKFTDTEVKLVETYLDQGGRVAFFANQNEEPGLETVLAKYGVQVDPGIVADARLNAGSPYKLVTPFFSDHEIGKLLKGLQMNAQLPLARGLSLVQTGTAEGVMPTPVLTSSPWAWVETLPNELPQPDSGEKVGQIPLVIASTRNTASAANKRFDEARLVVFGDSDLLTDANWGYDPNRNLVMNALAWATSQVNKVTIRPPDRDISSVDIDDKTMGFIRFYTMAVAPLTVLIVGLSIWIARRNK